MNQYHHLRNIFKTINHFFGGVDALFSGVKDPRNRNLITYPLECLLFSGLFLFLCRMGARRQIHKQLRGNVRSASKFKAIFDVADAPHGDTLNYSFKRICVEQVQEIVCRIVERLVRKKMLYAYRLFARYYLMAIDGTGILSFKDRHCDHCLTRKLKNGELIYYHPVLEAKLMTPTGFCFSVMSEFIENSDPGKDKQDCELAAFYRLSKRLKQRFVRMPICLLLDGLFAGGPTFRICEKYGWKYIINLKDDDLPWVNTEFESLCQLAPENRAKLSFQAGTRRIDQQYRFANDIAYKDSSRHQHMLHVFECKEKATESDGRIIGKKFKWVTNFKINEHNITKLANNGGRLRWKIENEGFNIQKNGGFELEHPYSKDENARKVFYLLLQVAHNIFQLIEKGSLFKKAFPNGVGSAKNLAKRFLEAWRNLQLTDQAMKNLGWGNCQIRFDTS
ncbi:MAG: hypothetical protein ACE5DO_12755 [Desulfobacterales bacterium]